MAACAAVWRTQASCPHQAGSYSWYFLSFSLTPRLLQSCCSLSSVGSASKGHLWSDHAFWSLPPSFQRGGGSLDCCSSVQPDPHARSPRPLWRPPGLFTVLQPVWCRAHVSRPLSHSRSSNICPCLWNSPESCGGLQGPGWSGSCLSSISSLFTVLCFSLFLYQDFHIPLIFICNTCLPSLFAWLTSFCHFG